MSGTAGDSSQPYYCVTILLSHHDLTFINELLTELQTILCVPANLSLSDSQRAVKIVDGERKLFRILFRAFQDFLGLFRTSHRKISGHSLTSHRKVSGHPVTNWVKTSRVSQFERSSSREVWMVGKTRLKCPEGAGGWVGGECSLC